MTAALDRVTTTTVDTVGEPPTVGAFIQQLRPELQRALPKGMDADRLARLALTVVRKDRALAQCSPQSFAGSLLTSAALGLEPGVNGEAYLVAYKGECTLIIGYQGFAKLFWQSPLAQHIDAQAVHDRDEFDYAYGLKPFLTHKPAKGDRGPITYYYAVATLTTGASAFVVLTPDEVKALRGGKTGSSGGIPDPMHWMERKTALRQLVKMLPRSTQLNQALEADERPGSELRREQVAAIEQAPAPAHDTVTGEVVDEAPADRGDPITRPQVTKIQAAFSGFGIADRLRRLRVTAALIRRQVASTNELTKAEASHLIEVLEEIGKTGDASDLYAAAGLLEDGAPS